MAHSWISYIPTRQSWSGWVGIRKAQRMTRERGESEYQEKEDDREEWEKTKSCHMLPTSKKAHTLLMWLQNTQMRTSLLVVEESGAWRRIFILTYLQYLASWGSNDAWTVSDDEGVSIQRKIWDFIYGDKIPHVIQGPVFTLVSILILLPKNSDYSFIQVDQRVCEWRSGFASAALSIINAFFDDNDYESDNSREEFAKSALDSWTFLYRVLHFSYLELSLLSMHELFLLSLIWLSFIAWYFLSMSHNRQLWLDYDSLLTVTQNLTSYK